MGYSQVSSKPAKNSLKEEFLKVFELVKGQKGKKNGNLPKFISRMFFEVGEKYSHLFEGDIEL